MIRKFVYKCVRPERVEGRITNQGMQAGARSTITGNTTAAAAAASGQIGIDVFCASNVFDNTARGNGGTNLEKNVAGGACTESNNLAP